MTVEYKIILYCLNNHEDRGAIRGIIMNINKIRIQNYKSIKDIEFDLKDVNLLVGPNNSGKTNILEAINFFGEVLSGQCLVLRISKKIRI